MFENMKDCDMQGLIALHSALKSSSTEYREAVDRALNIPGCCVVPYYGAFLEELKVIWEENLPNMTNTDAVSEVCNPTTSPIHFIHLSCLLIVEWSDLVCFNEILIQLEILVFMFCWN